MDHLRGLRIFARVIELRSFSKAAVDLNISQPSVTKNVAWLEARAGARLLDRNTRGGGPSELGHIYCERCKAILAQLEEADGLVRDRDAALDGSLRISTSVAFGEAVLGPMLVPFMCANARLRIELICESADESMINRHRSARGTPVRFIIGFRSHQASVLVWRLYTSRTTDNLW